MSFNCVARASKTFSKFFEVKLASSDDDLEAGFLVLFLECLPITRKEAYSPLLDVNILVLQLGKVRADSVSVSHFLFIRVCNGTRES